LGRIEKRDSIIDFGLKSLYTEIKIMNDYLYLGRFFITSLDKGESHGIKTNIPLTHTEITTLADILECSPLICRMFYPDMLPPVFGNI